MTSVPATRLRLGLVLAAAGAMPWLWDGVSGLALPWLVLAIGSVASVLLWYVLCRLLLDAPPADRLRLAWRFGVRSPLWGALVFTLLTLPVTVLLCCLLWPLLVWVGGVTLLSGAGMLPFGCATGLFAWLLLRDVVLPDAPPARAQKRV